MNDSEGTIAEADLGVSITLNVELSPEYGEPSDAVVEYRGEIVLRDENDEAGAPVGRVHVFVADIDASECLPFDILDCDGDTAAYLPLFESDSADFSPEVQRVLGEDVPFSSNVLILHRLEILADARGRGLGLAVIERLIRKLGIGCAAAVLKAFPLQHESRREIDDWTRRMSLDQFGGSVRHSTRKLQRYYARAGFKAVPGTGLMVRGLSE